MKRYIYILLLVIALPCSLNAKPFFRNVSALEYHGHNRNFDIECDTTGRVYVANFEGLAKWDGASWTMVHTPGVSRITSLFKAPDGVIWVGGYNTVGYIDSNDDIHYIASDTTANVSFGEISDIYFFDGHINFDAGNSYFIINGETIEEGAPLAGVSARAGSWHGIDVNKVLRIEDMALTILATKTEGVVICDMDGNVMDKIDTDDGLCSDNISSIIYDGKGSVWGTTDNGLFQLFVTQVYSFFDDTDGLLGQVTSILHSGGRLYVGTLQGLYVGDSEGHFTKVPGLDLACWQIVKTGKDDIIAATAQGAFKYDGGRLIEITPRHAISIFVESNNSFLTGEADGIYRNYLDGKKSEQLNDAPNVCKFVYDRFGIVWAINYYQETYALSMSGSLFYKSDNGDISLLFEYTDRQGRIWKSGPDNKGLVCASLSPETAQWCKPLDQYSIEAMDVDGDIAYIGGIFGLIRLDLGKMSESTPFKSKLYLRSFHNEDNFVSFSVSTDKSDPIGANLYSYRLHDNDTWSKWNSNPNITFDQLTIGKYQLSVQCQDAYGNISRIETLPFKIDPPFWFQWYALIFYLFVLVAIIFGFFRYRLYKARMEQLRLEEIVEQRTSQLKEAQNLLLRQEREATVGKLTKGLIDRILNPLNYINNFSHLSIELAKDISDNLDDDKDNMTEDIYEDCLDITDMLKTNLSKIEQHGVATTRILKAMEELLKDRSGKVEEADMAALCRKDFEMLQSYHKENISSYNIDTHFNIPDGQVIATVNQENVSKVIMSVLANSIYALAKKAQKGDSYKPEVTLSLEKGPGGKGCRIIVHDNGIGIEESIIDKIFDPFFTTKPTGEAPGVGLYLSQQVVQDLGGTIRAESKKDEYTQFTIELPQ